MNGLQAQARDGFAAVFGYPSRRVTPLQVPARLRIPAGGADSGVPGML
jgi:hypothetical protein